MTLSVAQSLAALAEFSARIGRDPLFVQGSGGNTSLKRDGRLWVKASGTWLANALDESIFVDLAHDDVAALLREPDGEARVAALAGPGRLRPSIETSLHALMPHPVVAHVHSVDAIAWAVRDDAREQLSRRLSGLSWALVPYRRPGRALTEAVLEGLGATDRVPDVLILANHGLVVAADTCDTADALLRDVQARLALPPRTTATIDRARLAAVNDAGWREPSAEIVHAVALDRVASDIAQRGALYPDHAVFLGAHAVVVADGATVAETIARNGVDAPVYVIVPDAGVLVSPAITTAAEAMLECFALVALRVTDTDRLAFLRDDDVAALIGWEAEKYRQSLDRARTRA